LNLLFLSTGTEVHGRNEFVLVASVVNLVSMRVLCRQQSAELDGYRRRYGDEEMNDIGRARLELPESRLNRLPEAVEYAPIPHQPVVRRGRREPSNPCVWQRFGNFFVTQMRGQIDDERKGALTRWRRRVDPGGCFGGRVGPQQAAAPIARKEMPIGSIAQLPANAHERGHVRKTHHGQVERITLGVGARGQSVTQCVVNVSLYGLPIVLVPAGASRRTQLENLNLLLRPKAFRKHRLEQVFATNQIFGRKVLADDDQSHRALGLTAFGRVPNLLDVVTVMPAQIGHGVPIGVRIGTFVARRAKEHQVFRVVGVLLRRCAIVVHRMPRTLRAGGKDVRNVGPIER
jgi:hypothetical protein